MRRFFPSRSLLVLFWIYAGSCLMILFILFNVNFMSKVDVDPIFILQAVNLVTLCALGWLLYMLIRMFFQVKFTRFISRVDRELKEMLERGYHPVKYRKSRLAPWFLERINDMNLVLFSRMDALDQSIEEIESILEQARSTGRIDPKRLEEVRKGINPSTKEMEAAES